MPAIGPACATSLASTGTIASVMTRSPKRQVPPQPSPPSFLVGAGCAFWATSPDRMMMSCKANLLTAASHPPRAGWCRPPMPPNHMGITSGRDLPPCPSSRPPILPTSSRYGHLVPIVAKRLQVQEKVQVMLNAEGGTQILFPEYLVMYLFQWIF